MVKKSMTLMTVVMVVALIFGMALPANAVTAGAVAFVANATLPAFPCPGGCNVSALGGPVAGVIAGTGPNGATVCATCNLSLGTVPLTYREPACVAGEVPATGTASGDVRINGGTAVLAPKTPLDLHISYTRVGAIAVVTFTGGQLGVAVGLFRPVAPAVPPCDGSGQTVQIVGAGVAAEL
jgi:hypothetical protein